MNPPFKGITHLSILHKAMLQSNEVVNLSPLLWLEFPDSDRKEGAFLEGKIIDLTSIERDYTRKLFNARIPSDIGIYHIGEKGNSLNSYNPFESFPNSSYFRIKSSAFFSSSPCSLINQS